MSNVLIGIIGVILFIGLALAGALILGDDFRGASASNRAAIVMSNVKQTADAMNMASLKTGAGVQCRTLDYLVPRFLKTLPINPMPLAKTSNDLSYRVQMNTDAYPEAAADMSTCGSGAPVMVIARLGGDDEARAVCQNVAESNGGVIQAGSDPTGLAGCTFHNGMYVAFQRL